MGGLTIVQELAAVGFAGRVSYAADTGFFPYGEKSDEDLIRRVPALCRALVEAADPDILVIACNTASTLALEVTRAVVDIPVVGTVPAIKPAAKATQTGVIGVLATPGTLRRAYTQALVDAFARHCRVLSHGSLKLVELAERFQVGEAVEREEICGELEALLSQSGGDEMDQIVLACTHFPLLRQELVACALEGVNFIDSGQAIARRVMSLLGQDLRASSEASLSPDRLLTTGASPSLERMIKAGAMSGFTEHHQIDFDDPASRA
tara:strand:- start:536 stop:1330 length:795 start_codon:yes stop_codon:yes gene_type:complete